MPNSSQAFQVILQGLDPHFSPQILIYGSDPHWDFYIPCALYYEGVLRRKWPSFESSDLGMSARNSVHVYEDFICTMKQCGLEFVETYN